MTRIASVNRAWCMTVVAQSAGPVSPFFAVVDTSYGGRGCAATLSIPRGTTVLTCAAPLGAGVVRPFRKEVCLRCFFYDNGRTLKHRIESKMGSLYFCTLQCRTEFEKDDCHQILRTSLVDLEHWYRRHSCEENYEEDHETLDESWQRVAEWEAGLEGCKKQQVPDITETDYGDLSYVLDVLYSQYTATNPTELALFAELQSGEQQKVAKYPYLKRLYTRMYKYLRSTAPAPLQPFVNIDNFRRIIGTSLTNAFGIWSFPTAQEDREYFGCALYPSASYFNHSCAGNLTRFRKGRLIYFVTNEDVPEGHELCIEYASNRNDDYLTRQEHLREWFFDCGCAKCAAEAPTA